MHRTGAGSYRLPGIQALGARGQSRFPRSHRGNAAASAPIPPVQPTRAPGDPAQASAGDQGPTTLPARTRSAARSNTRSRPSTMSSHVAGPTAAAWRGSAALTRARCPPAAIRSPHGSAGRPGPGRPQRYARRFGRQPAGSATAVAASSDRHLSRTPPQPQGAGSPSFRQSACRDVRGRDRQPPRSHTAPVGALPVRRKREDRPSTAAYSHRPRRRPAGSERGTSPHQDCRGSQARQLWALHVHAGTPKGRARSGPSSGPAQQQRHSDVRSGTFGWAVSSRSPACGHDGRALLCSSHAFQPQSRRDCG